ncbi:MAG: penicillin-binding protein 2 [Chloroflexi bacterium]|nr:penicillin-binding protein 2 [Chloroflexota bacterium]
MLTRRQFLRHSLALSASAAVAAFIAQSTGCAPVPSSSVTAPPPPTATPSPVPTAAVTPTPLPSPEPAIRAFLGAWEKGQYEAMYALLSEPSKANFSQEAFVKRYRDIAAEGAFAAIKTETREIEVALNKSVANFNVTISSTLAGDFLRQNQLGLTYEPGGWHVDWQPTSIFRELTPGNTVSMLAYGTSRGEIFDRSNQKLAGNESLVTVGVVPRDFDDEGKLLAVLAPLIEMDAKSIKEKYAGARPEWFTPLKDLTLDQYRKVEEKLKALSGVSFRDKERRVYPVSTTAEHVTGYVGAISADELLRMGPKGYGANDMIGKAGIEKWGETYLRGELGGTLLVMSQDSQIVATLGARGPAPAYNVFTTLHMDLQAFAENELKGKIGSAIVIDTRTAEVLALASSPGYDINTLIGGKAADLQALLNNKDRPLVNRATQGLYPAGSVYKIVTASAGLEKASFTPDSKFECEGVWTGLGTQYPKKDWLITGHGKINLFNGLVQSCDVVFYTVGLALDKTDRSLLPTYARAFGYGAPTRAAGLTDEAGGNVPDPTKETVFVGDMVNVAIGQGDLLATPLQVANMMVAVANGGTLYRPRLIAKVTTAKGDKSVDIPTETIGKLPVSAANLKTIRDALRAVTQTAPGTASRAFAGFPVPVAGKTGTAEAPPGLPHAWFAAYAPADSPKVAVVVMVEHSGEGSSIAAPIARRIFEKYFAANPP